jgi:hypothetical protein
MNKLRFVQELRATAATLSPLTESVQSGAAKWDGRQYVRADVKQPDAYALAWWSTLNAIAALVEAQDSPLTAAQMSYLNRTLFGTAGSLNDLYFDPKTLGAATAVEVNDSLNTRRQELYLSFHDNG